MSNNFWQCDKCLKFSPMTWLDCCHCKEERPFRPYEFTLEARERYEKRIADIISEGIEKQKSGGTLT